MKFVLAMVLITGVLSSPTTLSPNDRIKEKVKNITENLACLANYVQTVPTYKNNAIKAKDAANDRDRKNGLAAFQYIPAAKIQKDKEDGKYDCMKKYEPYYFNTILGDKSSVPRKIFCTSKSNKTTEFISILVENGECLRSSGEDNELPKHCIGAIINELDCLIKGYQRIISNGPIWVEPKLKSLGLDALSFDNCTVDEEKLHCMITTFKKYMMEAKDAKDLRNLFQIAKTLVPFDDHANAQETSDLLETKLKLIEKYLDAAWVHVTAVAPQAKRFKMTGLQLINSWIPRTTTTGPMTTLSSEDILAKMVKRKRNLKTIN